MDRPPSHTSSTKRLLAANPKPDITRLAAHRKPFLLRLAPCESAESRQAIRENPRSRLDGIGLLPYHMTAADKYVRMSKPYKLADVRPLSEERMVEIARIL